jgi:hypothetical protein
MLSTWAKVFDCVVLLAVRALTPVGVSTSVECSSTLMQQSVIRAVRADDEIRRAVVGPVFIDVVHFSATRQWLAKRSLRNHDVFKPVLAVDHHIDIAVVPDWLASADPSVKVSVSGDTLVVHVAEALGPEGLAATGDCAGLHRFALK